MLSSVCCGMCTYVLMPRTETPKCEARRRIATQFPCCVVVAGAAAVAFRVYRSFAVRKSVCLNGIENETIYAAINYMHCMFFVLIKLFAHRAGRQCIYICCICCWVVSNVDVVFTTASELHTKYLAGLCI